jgi:eukaryotic-like serine/threonine-protein kinase
MIGQMVGPYRILEKLGEGGMGEVYRARDAELKRDVAVKILPADLAVDPERSGRFDREGQALAALNHPHIAQVYGFAHEGALRAIVMELVEGPTLAERIGRGALPLDEALPLAIQLADALEYAHERGIVHRDLKPANIKLTADGEVKVLDFGLAKALAGEAAGSAGDPLGTSPTMMSPVVSRVGVILGTAAYMAPEQARGAAVDKRADIWAFGVVLFEMLTGKACFTGDTVTDVLAAVVKTEPDWGALSPGTPPRLCELLRRCLAKDRKVRWRDAGDARIELEEILAQPTGGFAAETGIDRSARTSRLAFLVVAGLAMAGAGAAAMWWFGPAAPAARTVHMSLQLEPAEDLFSGGFIRATVMTAGGSRTALTWTPDGEALVFVGRRNGVQQLYVRPLNALAARPLKGTADAQAPAVSPDGQWVAFWANGKIRKVRLADDSVMDVWPTTYPPHGLVYNEWGDLFFGNETDGRIWNIPAESTAKPSAVTTLGEAEVAHVLPWPLPGGRVLLYTVRKRLASWGGEVVVAETLATRGRTSVLADAADARYLPTGHLVFLRRGRLFAVPFDAKRLKVTGDAMPALEDDVAQALTSGNAADITGAGQYTVAGTGTIAWIRSPVAEYPFADLVALDRRGGVTVLPGSPHRYGFYLRLSPTSSRQFAAVTRDVSEFRLSLWTDPGGLRPLVGDGDVIAPQWSKDGKRIYFNLVKSGQTSVSRVSPDGGAEQTLRSGDFFPVSVTRDGRHLAATTGARSERDEIVILDTVDGNAPVQSLADIPNPQWPEFSPDDRWLLYGSQDRVSRRWEIYVQPYPGPGAAQPVSTDGGMSPAWNPSGKEVFFVSGTPDDGECRMMAAQFEPGPPAHVGTPRRLFPFDPKVVHMSCYPARCYDVSPDGQRFYAVRDRPSQPPGPVTYVNIIENWFKELKAKVPVPK